MTWTTKKLGDIADVQNGYAFKSKDFAKTGTPVIKIKNMASGNIIFDCNANYPYEINNLEKYILQNGDILVSMTGSHLSQKNSAVGKVTRYKAFSSALLNQRVGKIYCKDDTCNSDFLYFLLVQDESQVYWAEKAGGTANQANISPDIIKSLPVKIPNDIKTQTRIASVLSSYDDLIENNEKRIKALEEMAQLLYTEWFVKFKFRNHENVKMVESGTEYGEVPEGWEVKTVGDQIEVKKGKNITRSTIIDGNIPVVAGGLGPAYFHNTPNTNGPVVTISASGANSGFTRLYFQDVWASDCSYIDMNVSKYVYFYYLFLKNKQKEIYKLQRGSAQPHVYPKNLMGLNIVNVPESLMETFNEKVVLIFNLVGKLKKENQNLSKIRDLLISPLVTGRRELAFIG